VGVGVAVACAAVGVALFLSIGRAPRGPTSPGKGTVVDTEIDDAQLSRVDASDTEALLVEPPRRRGVNFMPVGKVSRLCRVDGELETMRCEVLHRSVDITHGPHGEVLPHVAFAVANEREAPWLVFDDSGAPSDDPAVAIDREHRAVEVSGWSKVRIGGDESVTVLSLSKREVARLSLDGRETAVGAAPAELVNAIMLGNHLWSTKPEREVYVTHLDELGEKPRRLVYEGAPPRHHCEHYPSPSGSPSARVAAIDGRRGIDVAIEKDGAWTHVHSNARFLQRHVAGSAQFACTADGLIVSTVDREDSHLDVLTCREKPTSAGCLAHLLVDHVDCRADGCRIASRQKVPVGEMPVNARALPVGDRWIVLWTSAERVLHLVHGAWSELSTATPRPLLAGVNLADVAIVGADVVALVGRFGATLSALRIRQDGTVWPIESTGAEELGDGGR
jgi:hypothetical protein